LAGDRRVDALTRRDIYALQDQLSDTLPAANLMIAVLRTTLEFGVRRGYRADNPASASIALRLTTAGTRRGRRRAIDSSRSTRRSGGLSQQAVERLAGERGGRADPRSADDGPRFAHIGEDGFPLFALCRQGRIRQGDRDRREQRQAEFANMAADLQTRRR
jgi:protein-disulfide isomerase-like protein with CxxC motif